MRTKQVNSYKKRAVISSLIILVVIPALIFLGATLWGGSGLKLSLFSRTVVLRPYYLTSLLILLCTFLPFALSFEKRKPQAREIVVVSVLCALAVAGRAVFFMLPQFKPITAIVIISGVALGGQAGFVVGAVSGFVSNFFFGQGPWTPWQMFSFGVIGFLAGVLAKKGWLPRRRVPLAVFGGAAALFVYGGIMNFSSLLLAAPEINWGYLLFYYGAGLPMDLIHAASTVVFLLLLSKPMIEKLDRIQLKFGLMRE